MAVAIARRPSSIVCERTPAYRIQVQTGAFNRSVRRVAELWAELFTDPAILQAFRLHPFKFAQGFGGQGGLDFTRHEFLRAILGGEITRHVLDLRAQK